MAECKNCYCDSPIPEGAQCLYGAVSAQLAVEKAQDGAIVVVWNYSYHDPSYRLWLFQRRRDAEEFCHLMGSDGRSNGVWVYPSSGEGLIEACQAAGKVAILARDTIRKARYLALVGD